MRFGADADIRTLTVSGVLIDTLCFGATGGAMQYKVDILLLYAGVGLQQYDAFCARL